MIRGACVDFPFLGTKKEGASGHKKIIRGTISFHIEHSIQHSTHIQLPFDRNKVKLSMATDEERAAAYEKKQQSRARYRQANRAQLAQKAKDRRERERQ